MILLIDNYDSFVYNLARYVTDLDESAIVKRHDAVTVSDIEGMPPSHVLISPGPGTPAEARVSVEVVQQLGPRIPVLGVCLGHQCIGAAYGARIVRARHPMHGKSSHIDHQGSGLFEYADRQNEGEEVGRNSVLSSLWFLAEIPPLPPSRE